ncbi:MAG: hypothetical protein BGO68_00235 [Candidatus Amoebophilus sp. 36-38]|nr:MAG: hypothetical protein BGO68_00235 [Candidatus Amoebophilus sp. 36-38]
MLIFTACETNTIYFYRHKLPDCKWHRDMPLAFNFNVQDTTQAYDVYLLIENTPQYPYQNFYLTYYLKDNSLTLLTTELKNYLLFEPKTGKPLGKGWTKNKSHEVIMMKSHYFTHPGTYRLELDQFMRTEILSGICSIGIKICRSSQVTNK